jgi:Rieske Fe-S protein
MHPVEQTTPFESEPPPHFTRRHLLDVLLGLSATAWLGWIMYPISRYLLPSQNSEPQEKSIKVGTKDQFKPNSGTPFRMGSKPGLLVRASNGEFRAFIAICTHLDCTVQFKADEGLIWCACHNGKYNLQGQNISGPPPRPLQTLVVTLKGDEVHVSLPA